MVKAFTAFRRLDGMEENIATAVFKDKIRYDRFVVTNGLGKGDRPFTVPAPLYAGITDTLIKYGMPVVGDIYLNLKSLITSKPSALYLLNFGDYYYTSLSYNTSLM